MTTLKKIGRFTQIVAGFFVNAIMLRITANLMDGGLVVDGWLPAIIGGIVLASVGALVGGLLGFEDVGAFYEGIIERRLVRQRAPQGRGYWKIRTLRLSLRVDAWSDKPSERFKSIIYRLNR